MSDSTAAAQKRGIFSRMWGGDPNAKGPTKAKLGTANSMYYDEKLKCWRDKDGDAPPPILALPPPPKVAASAVVSGEAGTSNGSSGGTVAPPVPRSSLRTARSGVNTRYASTGFGGAGSTKGGFTVPAAGFSAPGRAAGAKVAFFTPPAKQDPSDEGIGSAPFEPGTSALTEDSQEGGAAQSTADDSGEASQRSLGSTMQWHSSRALLSAEAGTSTPPAATKEVPPVPMLSTQSPVPSPKSAVGSGSATASPFAAQSLSAPFGPDGSQHAAAEGSAQYPGSWDVPTGYSPTADVDASSSAAFDPEGGGMPSTQPRVSSYRDQSEAAGGGDFLGDLSRAVPMDEGQGADNASSRATEMHPSADSTQAGGPRPDGAEGNAANDARQEHWEEYGQQEASAAIGEEAVVEYSLEEWAAYYREQGYTEEQVTQWLASQPSAEATDAADASATAATTEPAGYSEKEDGLDVAAGAQAEDMDTANDASRDVIQPDALQAAVATADWVGASAADDPEGGYSKNGGDIGGAVGGFGAEAFHTPRPIPGIDEEEVGGSRERQPRAPVTQYFTPSAATGAAHLQRLAASAAVGPLGHVASLGSWLNRGGTSQASDITGKITGPLPWEDRLLGPDSPRSLPSQGQPHAADASPELSLASNWLDRGPGMEAQSAEQQPPRSLASSSSTQSCPDYLGDEVMSRALSTPERMRPDHKWTMDGVAPNPRVFSNLSNYGRPSGEEEEVSSAPAPAAVGESPEQGDEAGDTQGLWPVVETDHEEVQSDNAQGEAADMDDEPYEGFEESSTRPGLAATAHNPSGQNDLGTEPSTESETDPRSASLAASSGRAEEGDTGPASIDWMAQDEDGWDGDGDIATEQQQQASDALQLSAAESQGSITPIADEVAESSAVNTAADVPMQDDTAVTKPATISMDGETEGPSEGTGWSSGDDWGETLNSPANAASLQPAVQEQLQAPDRQQQQQQQQVLKLADVKTTSAAVAEDAASTEAQPISPPHHRSSLDNKEDEGDATLRSRSLELEARIEGAAGAALALEDLESRVADLTAALDSRTAENDALMAQIKGHLDAEKAQPGSQNPTTVADSDEMISARDEIQQLKDEAEDLETRMEGAVAAQQELQAAARTWAAEKQQLETAAKELEAQTRALEQAGADVLAQRNAAREDAEEAYAVGEEATAKLHDACSRAEQAERQLAAVEVRLTVAEETAAEARAAMDAASVSADDDLADVSRKLAEAAAERNEAVARAQKFEGAQMALRQQLRAAEEVQQQQSQSLQASTAEISALKERLSALITDNTTAAEAARKLAADREAALEQRCAKLESQKDGLAQALKDGQAEIGVLQEQLDATVEEGTGADDLRKQLTDSQASVEELQVKVTTLAAAEAKATAFANHVRRKLGARLRDAEAATAAAKARALEEQSAQEAATVELEELQNGMDHLRVELTSVHASLTEKTSELENALSARQEADQKLQEAQQHLLQSNSDMKDAQSRTSALEATAEEATRRAVAAEAAIAKGAAEEAEAEERRVEEESAAATALAEIHDLRQQLDQANSAMEAMQDDLMAYEDADTQREALHARFNSLADENTSLKAQMRSAFDEADEEAAAAHEADQKAQLTIFALQTRVAALEADLEQSQASKAAPAASDLDNSSDINEQREQVEEQQREFNELLACLGQESSKVAALMALLEGAGLSDQADAAVAEVDAEQGFDNDVMPEGEPWGGNGTRSIDTPVEDARLYESSLHEVADAAVERTWQDESSTHDMAGTPVSGNGDSSPAFESSHQQPQHVVAHPGANDAAHPGGGSSELSTINSVSLTAAQSPREQQSGHTDESPSRVDRGVQLFADEGTQHGGNGSEWCPPGSTSDAVSGQTGPGVGRETAASPLQMSATQATSTRDDQSGGQAGSEGKGISGLGSNLESPIARRESSQSADISAPAAPQPAAEGWWDDGDDLHSREGLGNDGSLPGSHGGVDAAAASGHPSKGFHHRVDSIFENFSGEGPSPESSQMLESSPSQHRQHTQMRPQQQSQHPQPYESPQQQWQRQPQQPDIHDDLFAAFSEGAPDSRLPTAGEADDDGGWDHYDF